MPRIKPVPERDLDRLLTLQIEAYPGFDIDLQKARESWPRRQADKRSTFYGLYDGGDLLGAIRLLDFRLNLFGRMTPVGGGGSLAVGLLHKKQHVAKRLMKFFFNHYRRRGAPLAMLWPFRPDFYRRMGCGYGAKGHRYSLLPAALPRGRHDRAVRYLDKSDVIAVNACYNRWAARTHGATETPLIAHELAFEFAPKRRWVGYVKDGEVLGYLAFQFEKGDSGNWLDNRLEIIELIYETPEVMAALMHFLHTQFDQIARIYINTFDDDFHFLPSDPRNESGALHPSVHHECNVSGVGMMFRALDVEGLFEAISHRRFLGPPMKVGMTIGDSFLPANRGRRVIEVKRGRAKIAPNNRKTDVEVKIDVAEFSSLILGAVRFRSLYDYGLVRISDEELLAPLDAVFTAGAKPTCTTAF